MTFSSVGAIQPTGYFKYTQPAAFPNFNIGMYDKVNYFNSAYPIAPITRGIEAGGMINPNIGALPFTGDTAGFDNTKYFDNMKQYQQFYNDYYIDQQNMYRNQQLQVNAPMNSIQQAARNLKDKINQNEQEQVPQAFKAYVKTVAEAYGGDAEDQNVVNQALALYAQMNEGITLEQDLRQAGNGSFTQGLISGITFGLYGSKSAEENISEITGQPVGKDENIKKKVGGALGTAVWGAGIGACFGGPVGAAVGGIIGAVAGLFIA